MNAYIWIGSLGFLCWMVSIGLYWAKRNPIFGFTEQDLED